MTTQLNTPLLAKVAEEAGIGYVKCYDPFHLVAILEAKAAERGWYFRVALKGNAHQLRKVNSMAGIEAQTEMNYNDPINPTDTANAKILCLAEVFGVEE